MYSDNCIYGSGKLETLIPFHSLTVCQSQNDLDNFLRHERLSKKHIEIDLVGNQRFNKWSPVIFTELCHRINLKLSLGERVAVAITDLSPEQQKQLYVIATNQGVKTINYTSECVIVKSFSKSDWNGITVAGDLHGNKDSLLKLIEWASSRNHYLWFLGDIVDYGKDSLDVVNIVYEFVMNGQAALILGNHEKKIARWIDQKEKNGTTYLKLSDGNKVTITALEKLSIQERKKWIFRYKGLIAHSQLMQKFDNTIFVHAAVHPSLWTARPDEYAIEQMALYGESVQIDKTFRKLYNWVDYVPNNQTVFVGHDVLRSSYPTVKSSKSGGTVVFLDTGSGKGGYLSSADLKFEKNGLHLECFKRY